MRLYKISNLIFLSFILFFSACEDVIEIDLNTANTVLVAEGVLEKDSIAWIQLSYTTDYFYLEESAKVVDAQVILSDEFGNSEILNHIYNGRYIGKTLIGSVNTNYSIQITTDEFKCNAETYLHSPSKIYSVEFEKKKINRPGNEGNYSATITFKDDGMVHNFYMLKFWINGEPVEESYSLVDDKYYAQNDVIEYSPFRIDFEEGDLVLTKIYSIDESTYTYYNQLNDNNGNGMNSSTPYNAKSNFGNDVLGYFTTWSVVGYVKTVN